MVWSMSETAAASSPDAPVLVVALTRPGANVRGQRGLEDLAGSARAAGALCLSAPGVGLRPTEVRPWVGSTLDRLLSAAPGRPVLLGTDDPQVAALGQRVGCIPMLIVDRSASWPVDSGLLEAEDPMILAPFLANRPSALLRLLRTSESEIHGAHQRAASRFLEALRDGGRLLVFGSGTVGRQVVRGLRAHGLEPGGLLDNNVRRQGAVVDGLIVLAPRDIAVERDVVVVAVGMAAAAIEEQLDEQQVAHHFNLSEMLFALGAHLERDLARQLVADRLDYVCLYSRLADAASRECLDAFIQHRLTLDTGNLARVCVRHEPQWFDRDVIPDDDGHVLVDGGAYDGDTLAAFSARFSGRFRHAYGFEPDRALAARAAAIFAADPRVTVWPKGLADFTGQADFSVTGATDGSVGDASALHPGPPLGEPGSQVDVVRLDDQVTEPVSFLKLDVEGAELAAMRGAVGQIANARPTLAIAVYHRASDIRDVPRFIAEHRTGDLFYLRHYTDVSFETVLYALPGQGAD